MYCAIQLFQTEPHFFPFLLPAPQSSSQKNFTNNNKKLTKKKPKKVFLGLFLVLSSATFPTPDVSFV